MANLFKVQCFLSLFGWYCLNIFGLFIPFIVFSFLQCHSQFSLKFREVASWFTWRYWYSC